MPLLAKYSKFAGVDDKLRASDRMRSIDPAQDTYARSTVGVQQPAAEAEAEPAPVAAAPRKLTRVRPQAVAPVDPTTE